MGHSASRSTMPDRPERAALVGLFNATSRHFDPDHPLDELAGLASAAGAAVVLRVLQERPKPDPATFLGSGKVASLAASCDELNVDVVIFDNELTPAQLRNLEEKLDRKVVDRTQLILDIFARRARTREGKLQVELAQLKYLLPRLVGSAVESALVALAKPSSKPIAAASDTASAFCQKTLMSSGAGGNSCVSGATRRRCRRSRWSAIPMPVRRRCSTR